MMGLAYRLSRLLVGVTMVILLASGIMEYHAGCLQVERDLERVGRTVVDRLCQNLQRPVYQFDDVTIHDTVLSEFPRAEVAAILVWNENRGSLIAGWQRGESGSVEAAIRAPAGDEIVAFRRRILENDDFGGRTLGEVFVYLDRRVPEARLWRTLLRNIGKTVLTTLMVATLLALLVNRGIMMPLDALRAAMQRGHGGGADPALAGGAMDGAFPEVRQIHEAFQRLMTTIDQRQRELSESEARYRALFENAGEGLAIVEQGTARIRRANPALCRLLGYADGALDGQPVGVLHAPEWTERLKSRLRDNPGGRIVQVMDVPYLRQDGGEVYADLMATRMTIDGTECQVAFIVDATSRREAAMQREQIMQADKLTALGTLVAGVAHEINNPTQFIMLNAPLLKDVWDDAFAAMRDGGAPAQALSEALRQEGDQAIQGILEGAHRIRAIVDELKAFARKTPEAEREPVDLNRVIQSAVTLAGSKIRKSTHRFEMACGEDLPAVQGNTQRLEQVVINLLINACEAVQNPEAAIRLTTGYDRGRREVWLRVDDEGIGMSEGTLARIRDPFFTTKRESGGTGLGVSISSRVVEEHGGRLVYTSMPQRGTTVEVRLPCSEARG